MAKIGHPRLVLASLLAIAILPASALVYLQYRSLSQMQAQMRLAVVGSLRQALIGSRLEAQSDFQMWPRRALTGLDIHEWLRRGDVAAMKGAAETTRRICPYISLFFGSRTRAGAADDIFVFRPAEMRRMEFTRADRAGPAIAAMLGEIDETTSHWYYRYGAIDGEPQQLFVHLVDDCPVEPRGPHQGKFGYYGFAVTARAMGSRYLVRVLEKHLAPLAFLGGRSVEAVGAVADGSGSRWSPSPEAGDNRFLATEDLGQSGGILPGWTAQAGYPAEALAALDRTGMMKNLAAMVAVAALLLAGVAVLSVTAAREMKVSRAKSDFVASVSHELKTPLSLIQGFVETLRLDRVSSPEQRQEYLAIVEAQTRKLAGMIDRILDLSKIEAGLKRYSPEVVDPAALIEGTLANFAHVFEKSAFSVERRIEAGLPPVRVDPQAFTQALSNLLSNAVKYSENDRRITVGARRRDRWFEVSVTDRGIGIPRSEQRRIFDRFYRSRGAAAKAQGAGLGLALVRHFAAAHGGEVTVASAPGKGSSFAIRLPLAAENDGHAGGR